MICFCMMMYRMTMGMHVSTRQAKAELQSTLYSEEKLFR